jgi:Fe-S cluster biogenesis protein NfuA
MDVKGVTAVMVGSNFVTVTKGDDGEWDELNDAVMSTLDAHLESNEPVVDEAAVAAARATANSGGEGSVEQRIRDILDAEIRPAVAQDGGDITLDRFENGIAYLHMQGSCSGCPSSTATLKMGIEGRLREVIPEVVEVVSI